MNGRPSGRTLVFVGGGHAHLYALKRTPELVRAGFRVVLVSPAPELAYSGMATGVVSGYYAPGDGRIDLRPLVRRGGEYLRAEVVRVLPESRELVLGDGGTLGYDLASFCVGSESVLPAVPGALPVKPVENLTLLRERLTPEAGGFDGRLVVVGGGAAGCEVAANAAAAVGGERVAVVEAAGRLLPDGPGRASRLMRSHLESRDVRVVLGRKVVAGEAGAEVALDDGTAFEAGLVVGASGVRAPGVFARSGLPTGADGGMLVREDLRSVAAPELFGGGDCVSLVGGGPPKFGVHAVRQGPVLFANLLRSLRGESLRPYRPQRRNLYVMNLGDGTGLGVYGGFAWRGRSALALKDYIDRRFIREYRVG